MHEWVESLAADAQKRAPAESMIAKLDDSDIEAWGFSRDELWAPLSKATGQNVEMPARTASHLSAMRGLEGVHASPEGVAAVHKLRYYCDVVLKRAPQLG